MCEPTGGSASDAGGHRDRGSECEGVTRAGNVSPKLKNQRESSGVHTPLALAFQQMLGARRDSLSVRAEAGVAGMGGVQHQVRHAGRTHSGLPQGGWQTQGRGSVHFILSSSQGTWGARPGVGGWKLGHRCEVAPASNPWQELTAGD